MAGAPQLQKIYRAVTLRKFCWQVLPFRKRATASTFSNLALLRACKYCQDPDHREELIDLLSAGPGMEKIRPALTNSLSGNFKAGLSDKDRDLPDFHIFYDPSINIPSASAAAWFRNGFMQSGLVGPEHKIGKDKIFRVDLYEKAQSDFDTQTVTK